MKRRIHEEIPNDVLAQGFAGFQCDRGSTAFFITVSKTEPRRR
jgi:hypothetical protein